MLVPEDGLGARVFPADLARFLVDYYRQKGVELRMGEGMTGLEARAGKAVVRTTKNSQFTTDVIVAGLIVGPHVPIPLVADSAVVQTLSELGVILLMFSLGLEFSIRKLAQVGPTAGSAHVGRR